MFSILGIYFLNLLLHSTITGGFQNDGRSCWGGGVLLDAFLLRLLLLDLGSDDGEFLPGALDYHLGLLDDFLHLGFVDLLLLALFRSTGSLLIFFIHLRLYGTPDLLYYAFLLHCAYFEPSHTISLRLFIFDWLDAPADFFGFLETLIPFYSRLLDMFLLLLNFLL